MEVKQCDRMSMRDKVSHKRCVKMSQLEYGFLLEK